MNPLCSMCNPAAPIQGFCSHHALELVNGYGRPVAGECRCPSIMGWHMPGCLVGALAEMAEAKP